MALHPSIAEVARAGAPDRYFGSLLAPHRARDGLIAYIAFHAEISLVPSRVEEPLAGEIRLQWWRDAVTAGYRSGERTGHPTADALIAALVPAAVPIGPILGQIDAVAALLDDMPFADLAALRSHFAKVESAAMVVATRLLGAAHDPAIEAAALNAGMAYGLARLLYDLPADHAEGRMLLPATMLAEAGLTPGEPVAEALPLVQKALAAQVHALADMAKAEAASARRHMAELKRPCRDGFLPLAMVPVYLSLIDGVTDRWLQQIPVSPLTRLWRLWRAHSFGQFS